MALATTVLAEGFVFTEGPRWRDGRIWTSDMHGHRVVAIGLDGVVETVATVEEDEPSGLGWLPDGRLLIVSMDRQWLLRQEHDGTIVCHADLSSVARGSLNDMIVANDGTAYVGDMGSRVHVRAKSLDGPRVPGQTFIVRPDGSFEVGADDMAAPNGHVLTDDEQTLLVAQSSGQQVTAFDRAEDGTLSNRRVYVDLVSADPAVASAIPDGICLDSEGAVWVADPMSRRLFRVSPGGAVTDSVGFGDDIPVACVLGGADRRTLFVCVAASFVKDELEGTATSKIVYLPVFVPGAGKP